MSVEGLPLLYLGVPHHLRGVSVLDNRVLSVGGPPQFPKHCLIMSPGLTATLSGGCFEFLCITGT